jgi:IclR family acetate operon transcriptional repressor
VLAVKDASPPRRGGGFGLRDAARPAMRRLLDATGEAIHLSVLDGLDVVTVDQVDPTQVLRIHRTTGAPYRACVAASEEAILALHPADGRGHPSEELMP